MNYRCESPALRLVVLMLSYLIPDFFLLCPPEYHKAKFYS